MTSPITERAARAIFPAVAKLADFNAEGIGDYDDPDDTYLREESIRIVEMVIEALSPPPMTGVINHSNHNKVGIERIYGQGHIIDCSRAHWHGNSANLAGDPSKP